MFKKNDKQQATHRYHHYHSLRISHNKFHVQIWSFRWLILSNYLRQGLQSRGLSEQTHTSQAKSRADPRQ